MLTALKARLARRREERLLEIRYRNEPGSYARPSTRWYIQAIADQGAYRR